jgi:hypothetical protein
VVHVERFVVGMKEVQLAYRVDNSSANDIWVCDDMEAHIPDHSVQSVATNVIGDSLWIKLQYRRPPGQDWRWSTIPFARYHRVRPGQSGSGMIVLALPVRDASPIYRYPRSSTPVMARRVVLEIGFFTADLPTIISEENRTFLEDAGLEDADVSLPKSSDPNMALVLYGMNILETEQTTQTVIDNVNVPCVALVRTR